MMPRAADWLLYAGKPEEVKLEETPLLEAVVAIEDTRFYQHLG